MSVVMTFRLFQVQEKLWQMCCSCAWGDAVDVWGHEVKGSGRWRRRCMKRWMKAKDGLGHGNSFPFLSPGYRFVRNHTSERSCCMLRGFFYLRGSQHRRVDTEETAAGCSNATSACHWELWELGERLNSNTSCSCRKVPEKRHFKGT